MTSSVFLSFRHASYLSGIFFALCCLWSAPAFAQEPTVHNEIAPGIHITLVGTSFREEISNGFATQIQQRTYANGVFDTVVEVYELVNGVRGKRLAQNHSDAEFGLFACAQRWERTTGTLHIKGSCSFTLRVTNAGSIARNIQLILTGPQLTHKTYMEQTGIIELLALEDNWLSGLTSTEVNVHRREHTLVNDIFVQLK